MLYIISYTCGYNKYSKYVQTEGLGLIKFHAKIFEICIFQKV